MNGTPRGTRTPNIASGGPRYIQFNYGRTERKKIIPKK